MSSNLFFSIAGKPIWRPSQIGGNGLFLGIRQRHRVFLAALIFGQWLGFRIQNDDYAGAYSCDAKHRAVLKTSDMNGADVEDESNELGLALATRFGHDILEVPTHSADRRL